MAAKRKIAPPRPDLTRPWNELTKAQQNHIYTKALHAYQTGAGPNPATRAEYFRAKEAAK